MAKIIDLSNKVDLSDKQIAKLFEAKDALDKLFEIGYHEYDEALFVKMLNETTNEIEKRAYK